MNKTIIEKIKLEQKFYHPSLRAFILGYERWYISQYLLHLRLAEYYGKSKKKIVRIILGGIHMYINRYYGRKTGFQIPRYTCGFGLKIHHYGYIIINKNAKIGCNCDIYPGVVLGETSEMKVPIIGNNCFIWLGSKIIGNIKIGNNVIIAPNAVVTKDFPDNVIIGGIPAKIIKPNEK